MAVRFCRFWGAHVSPATPVGARTLRSRQHTALRGQRLRVGAVPDRARSAPARRIRGEERTVFPPVQGRQARYSRVSRFPARAARAPPPREARGLARGIHAGQGKTPDTTEGNEARAAAPRGKPPLRDRHIDQRFHHRADRTRVRRRSPSRNRARGPRRKVYRQALGCALLPPGQGDAPRGMASRAGTDARLVFVELVLQRLAERPAAPRARHAPRRGGPRRDAAPRGARSRVADHQPGMKTVTVLVVALVPASLALAIASARLAGTSATTRTVTVFIPG